MCFVSDGPVPGVCLYGVSFVMLVLLVFIYIIPLCSNALPDSHHFPWFCWNRCLSFYMPYYQSYSWSGLPVTLLENVPSRTTSCAPSRGNHLTILLLILSMENINWSRYKTNLRSPKGGQKKIVVTIKYILIRYFYNILFTHHYNLVNL